MNVLNQTWYKRKMKIKSKSKVENVKIEYEKIDIKIHFFDDTAFFTCFDVEIELAPMRMLK